MSYKQPSGAKKRKMKTKTDAMKKLLRGSLDKFVKIPANEDTESAKESQTNYLDEWSERAETAVENSSTNNVPENVLSSSSTSSYSEMENNFASDVGLWPNEITDEYRDYFTFNKPDQFISEISSSKCKMGNEMRSLNESNFYRKKRNGEVIKRDWLVYSPFRKATFCYVCKLFSNSDQALCKAGFSYWKNINERLREHENSFHHRDSVLKFSQRQSAASRIDSQMVHEYNKECEYWRQILKRTIVAIKFLAQRGLAFYGNNETINSPHNGNFLGVMEVIGQFDPFLAEHLAQCGNPGKGKVNYLSSTTVAELTEIMGKKVLNTILHEVRNAKYFGLIVDSTPDITHNDQLSVVLRYVSESGEPVERFITFLHIHHHEAEYLSRQILLLLEQYDLDIKNCRGQSYDNASNMSGKYSGLQAQIKHVSPLAQYVPCAAHSLNLVGVHAVECCTEVVSFFGLMQAIYVFFAASTQRWDRLSAKFAGQTKLTLKRVCDTRWSAAADATKCLRHNYVAIMDIFVEMGNDLNETPSTRHEAKCLLKKLQKFETAVLTVVWDSILQATNKVNKTLQSKSADLMSIVPLYDSLIKLIQSVRNDLASYETEASSFVQDTYSMKRHQKAVMCESFKDKKEEISGRDLFLINCHYVMCDMFISELERRKHAYLPLQRNFGFLLRNPTSVNEIKIEATDFQNLYCCDIDKEFAKEFYQFSSFLPKDKMMTPEEKLSIIRCQNMVHTFPNVDTAFQILLTLPITNCSSERSFSVMKRIKNRLRSSTKQDKLSHLAILSIESDLTSKLEFDDIIDTFSALKSRKKPT